MLGIDAAQREGVLSHWLANPAEDRDGAAAL